jgi:transposase
MFYVGIDIAKHNHEAAILDDSGNVVCKPFSFLNSSDGCNKVLAALAKLGASKPDTVIAMEATGHYWLGVYSFFCDYGFDVKVVNPIQSDSFRSLSIRKCKTDSVDSVNIAQLIRFGKYSSCSVPDENLPAIKNLCRFRFFVVDTCSDIKRKVIAILDRVFPEYANPFSDTFGTTSRESLGKFSVPEDFLNVSTTKLTNFIKSVSKGRLGKDTAIKIKSAAENSFEIKFALDSFTFQLRMLMEQLDFAENQPSYLDAEISRLLQTADGDILTTITFGTTLSAVVIGEIGSISKFDSPKKLVAYAGIDASVVQSGQFTGSQSKISKRGSPYLRRALFPPPPSPPLKTRLFLNSIKIKSLKASITSKLSLPSLTSFVTSFGRFYPRIRLTLFTSKHSSISRFT